METLVEPQLQSIIEMGKEFAYEGLDPSYFKAETADEYRAFKKGYEQAMELLRNKELVSEKSNDESTTKKM